MKRHHVILAVLGASLAVFLSACQGGGGSASGGTYDKVWKKAVSDGSIREYVKTNKSELDIAELEKAAGDESTTLNQQFKATVLLCELEYQNYMTDNEQTVPVYNKDGTNINGTNYVLDNRIEIARGDDIFAAEYPVGSAYAERFLAQVENGGEGFWEAIESASYPYNYFMNLFAASDSLSGDTLVKLTMECPDSPSSLKEDITKAADKWLSVNPQKLPEVGEQLVQAGYFKDKKLYDLSVAFFGTPTEPVRLDDVNEGLAYIQFMKTTMFPMYEQDFSDDFKSKKVDSELLGSTYYSTGMDLVVPDMLDLKEEVTETETETVELDGKKVVAFYHNPDNTEFADSPEPLRVLGDFMLTLPEDQAAATLEEADYYLVLTPDYVLGEFYQMNSSAAMEIQEVYSFTSVDLYDAASGMLVRHLGTVKESPSDSLFYRTDEDRSELEYPAMVSADQLLFMYQNINEPDIYRHLTEAYGADQSALGAGETAQVGTWEMTLESHEVMKSFEKGMFVYTAKDGHKFLRTRFTITNLSNEEKRLFPTVYYVGKDMSLEIKDEEGNTYQPLAGVSSSDYFEGTTFAAGESMSRYILFEIPDSMADGEQPVRLEFAIKPQTAVYVLE